MLKSEFFSSISERKTKEEVYLYSLQVVIYLDVNFKKTIRRI